jgi:eukaryotic-like serine/threonine-protein kinase
VIEAMAEIGRGHLDHRIAETRRDEFGLLFAAFDRMAQGLQEAQPAPLTPTPTRAPAREPGPVTTPSLASEAPTVLPNPTP